MKKSRKRRMGLEYGSCRREPGGSHLSREGLILEATVPSSGLPWYKPLLTPDPKHPRPP